MVPPIISGLSDYIGTTCTLYNLPRLEEHIVRLQIVYSTVHPFNIRHGKVCTVGPFVVRDGILQHVTGSDRRTKWATSSGECLHS
jgi:hypothetical protein